MNYLTDYEKFSEAVLSFKELMAFHDNGNQFTNFREGVAAVEEDYKPKLRERALSILGSPSWDSSWIGTGKILKRTIAAIEIDARKSNLINNLVFWQNRFGQSNQAHHALLDAQDNSKLTLEIEHALFSIFVGENKIELSFNKLAILVGNKYPLMAYLFFLKDSNKYMPILPTKFDQVFERLNIDLVTSRNCSWENYSEFNKTLLEVRQQLIAELNLADVELIDAHSFCWMLQTMEAPSNSGGTLQNLKSDKGTKFGARKKSIWEMQNSVLKTVKQSQKEDRVQKVKLKELRMTKLQLEELIEALLNKQEDKCALTGLPLQYFGTQQSDHFLPSLDRIDSNKHYEKGNLQVVCRFINFWKQSQDNEEFKELLMLVRGEAVE